MNKMRTGIVLISTLLLLAGCSGEELQKQATTELPAPEGMAVYTPFELTADLSALGDNQKKMIPLLIEAGKAMDAAFWIQAYGDKQQLLDSVDDRGSRQVRRDQLRPLVPAERQRALHRWRWRQAAGGQLLPAGHDEGRVRGGRGDLRGARRRSEEPLHHGAAGRRRATWSPSRTTSSSPTRSQSAADKLRAAAALAEDPGTPELPRAARRGAAHRRLLGRATWPGWT